MQQMEATGLLQQRGPGRPGPTATRSWETFGAPSLCHGSERCSWINGANPQLSSPLCLIDSDGFSSAFVGEKCCVCYCVKEPDDHLYLHSVHAHMRAPSSFQIARKDGCY